MLVPELLLGFGLARAAPNILQQGRRVSARGHYQQNFLELKKNSTVLSVFGEKIINKEIMEKDYLRDTLT
jgi:hypothetical protein